MLTNQKYEEEALLEAAFPTSAMLVGPWPVGADPWIHGSMDLLMNHIFYNEMKNRT